MENLGFPSQSLLPTVRLWFPSCPKKGDQQHSLVVWAQALPEHLVAPYVVSHTKVDQFSASLEFGVVMP